MAVKIKQLDEKNFDDFIGKGDVIVDFYADWCGPCKILGPELEKASKEIKGVKFGKVDVDRNQDLAGRFGVMSIPTLIFFKNGKQVDKSTGVLDKDEILEKIKEIK